MEDFQTCGGSSWALGGLLPVFGLVDCVFLSKVIVLGSLASSQPLGCSGGPAAFLQLGLCPRPSS